MCALWSVLYEFGVGVVVNGHDHHYERFAPLDAKGRPDPNGTRQFVVGTGGGGVYKIKRVAEHSEIRDNSTYGVLRLALLPGKYEWTFVAVEGQTFTDAGSGTCSPLRTR
jgi:acid phosphatase type 7